MATIAERSVNGFTYSALQPLIGTAGDPPPPAPILWLAVRLHPELRRRNKAAANALRTKQWRARTAWWHSTGRAAQEAANRSLQDEPIATFDDAELVDHLRRAVARMAAGMELHMDLHADDLGPLGLFLTGCRQWGIEPADAIGALAGHSPSTTAGVDALRVVADAIGDAPVSSLDDIRAHSPEAAAALDAYLDRFGWHVVTGYDVDARTIGELPDALLANLRACRSIRPGLDGDAVVAGLRAKVPVGTARDEFDDALADARIAMDLRDANGPMTVEWPSGLVRRALLEVGRRLVDRGALDVAEHAVELSVDEVAASLLRGEPLGDIAERASQRRAAASFRPPLVLGPPEEAPPLHLFPKPLATMVEMVTLTVALLERDPAATSGMGVGTEPHTGRARVVRCADDALDAVEPGDVLVVPFTTPAYNAVLAVVGAVVTEEGGVLSHTAVLARELGFPAVVGASGALARIPDGALVTVDPTTGGVTVES
jgi:pyruvate,water dikinase